ncbi:hypothetical protein MTO96_038701 [Rhipicephalus appendiculatus]
MKEMMQWSVLFARVNKLQRQSSCSSSVNVSSTGLEEVFIGFRARLRAAHRSHPRLPRLAVHHRPLRLHQPAVGLPASTVRGSRRGRRSPRRRPRGF